MKIYCSIIVTIFISNGVLAGNATGTIESVVVSDSSNSILFTVSAPIADTPRCNEAKRFAVALNKPGGMATFMTILEAKRERYNVAIEGTNTCSNEWKSEDIRNLELQ